MAVKDIMSSKFRVTYFNFKGYAEPIRYILSYAGIEFDDVRIDEGDWPTFRAHTPFGKLPMVEIDGKKLHHSTAQIRYLAKEMGIAGEDNWEAMLIDMAADVVIEIRDMVGNYGWGISETEKSIRKEKIMNYSLPFYLSGLNKQVAKNHDYLVNGKLSYADIVFAASTDFLSGVLEVDVLAEYTHLRSLEEKINKIPRIQEWINKRPPTIF